MYHKTALECKVTGVVDAGLSLEWNSMAAFIDQGQLELGAPHALESYVGKMLHCQVLQLHAQRLGIVMGRRNLLAKAKIARQDHALSRMRVGDTVNGIVKNLAPYGAFVDLGGVDDVEAFGAQRRGCGIEGWEVQVGQAGHGAAEVDLLHSFHSAPGTAVPIATRANT